MTTFLSTVLPRFSLLRSLSLVSIACVLCDGMTSLAQHHSEHLHSHGFGGFSNSIGGDYNNFGAYNGPYHYNYGGFNASAPLGGVSFGNGFGTATYSSRNFGVTTYGVSPSVFGNGTGAFGPSFLSGNSFPNGYIGLVPSGGYNPWCHSGSPYVTGLNPYFAGPGIAPTVVLLNMNVNMQPMVPFTGSYSLMDPRMIDILAPAVDPHAIDPDGVEPAPVPQPPEPGNQPVLPDAPQLPIQTDGVPVLNEFNIVPREQKISSLAEKIHSLRYQASGDDAFHKSDYVTADVFYATAIKTAPDRRAPYLRMAMVRIALTDFPNAAGYLKVGLTMESDASRPWCTAEELYGQKAAERARSHGGPLWNWLAERPVSADRLLLAGTFQKLRGYNKTADEMLALASHAGPEATLVSEVMQLAANDIGPRAVADDLEQLVERASANTESAGEQLRDPAGKSAVETSGGIFLRGGAVAARTNSSAASPPLVIPAPVAAEESPPLLEIPLPEQN